MTKIDYKKYIMWAAIAVLYVLCFKIVIQSGYMFDDMWTYIDKGVAISNDTSVMQMVLESIHRWASSYGRILIFSFYCEFALCYLPLVVYKGLIVAAMFLDGLVLAGIIKELTGSKRLSYLTVIIFPAVLSMRATYYTGVYGFHGLVQLCLLLVLSAVYCYIRYRKTEKTAYQVASCVFWFMALGMYEVAYVLCVCFIAALICIDGWDYVKNNFWKSIKTGLPQIIIMIFWVAANVIARMLATGDYDGATPSFSISKIIVTFIKQCSGALGFGAALADWKNQEPGFWKEYISEYVGIIQILTYVLVFAALIYVLLRLKDASVNKLSSMFWMGALLVVMPSLLISVSVKYQKEVDWFQGYIPSYFGSWGFALIAATAVIMIGRKIVNSKAFICFNVAVALVFTGIFAFDNIVGAYSVEDVNMFYQNDVDTMLDSIDSGMFDGIGEDEYFLDVSYSTYTLDGDYTNRAYTTWLGRKCKARGWDDIYSDKGNTAELNDEYTRMKSKGFKVVNHLAKWYSVMADCNNLELQLGGDGYEYKAYVSGMDMFVYDYSPDTFTCKDVSGSRIRVNLSDGKVVKTGRYGSVYHFDFPDDIDISSIVIGE